MRTRHYGRLAWWFTILLLPGFMVGMFAVAGQYRSGALQLEASLMPAARALSQLQDTTLQRMQVALHALSAADSLAHADYPGFSRRLADTLERTGLRGTLFLIDENGLPLASASDPVSAERPAPPPLQLVGACMRGCGVVVSDPYPGAVDGGRQLAVLLPVRAGARPAVLAFAVPAAKLVDDLNHVALPPGWVATLLDRHGVILARSQGAARFVGRPAMAELRQAQAQHAEGTLELRSMDDEPALAAFHRSGFSGWAAVVAVPRAALLQPLYRTMAWITIAVALTLLVGGASAWGLNTSLQHVLDSLFAAAASAARGEHGARAHVGGPEDLAELARSFNRMQEQRESDEARLRLAASVFGNATEGILIVDAGMRIIEVNDAFLRLTGYARAELIGQHPRLLQSGRHNAEFYDDMRESLSQRGAFSGQLWDRRRDGSQFAANVNISTVRDEQGQLQHYVALFADITAQRLEQDRIEQMAFTDPLTGLANRRLMQDRLQNAIAQAQRRHHLVAVCAIDLDGFKEVNDTRGHEAGDGVLVAVAERLRHVVRANDTVARQGGDEFTLVLVDLPHAQEADDVAQRALAALRQPVPLAGGGQARISASIGIALYPAHARDPDGLLRAADEAMYTAKRRGRDQVLHAAANGKGPA